MILAALMGAGLGALLMLTLYHAEMLQERSGSAVLLAAVAVFYPVFAVIEGDFADIFLHSTVFLGFAWLALRGFRYGMHVIAGGLLAHGLFDIGLIALSAPGPIWWPVFCASLDIVAAAAMIRLVQTGKIAQ